MKPHPTDLAANGPADAVGPADTLPAAPEWPDVDGIERVEVAERLDGDVALFARMLGSLVDEFADLATATAVPRSAAGRARLAARLHKLRGGAGMLGARKTQALAAAAEAALVAELSAPGSGPAPAPAIDATLQALALALAQVRDSALRVLPRLAEAGAVASAAPSLPADATAVAALAMLLRASDLAALERFAAMSASLAAALDAERFARLQQAVHGLQFAAALSWLPGIHDERPPAAAQRA